MQRRVEIREAREQRQAELAASPTARAVRAQQEEQARLEAQAKKQAEREEARPFLTQANDEIVRTLEQWVTEQNRWNTNGQIVTDLQQTESSLVYTMKFPDGTGRRLEFTVLLAADHQVLINPQDPRERYYVTEFPTMRTQPIRGVGSATLEDGRGCNLILLARENAPKGDWLLQINSLNPAIPQMEARPGPFPLTVREITDNLVTVLDRDGIALQKYRSRIDDLEYPRFRQFFFDAGARTWEKYFR